VADRIIGVALIGIASLVAGCGSLTGPDPRTPTLSDEDQIRRVIALVTEGGFDFDAVAPLTCAKYRDQVGVLSEDDVPPMNALPLDVFSSMPPATLEERLGAEYAGASDESVHALVEALLSRDEAAYSVAMADVMAQTVKLRLDEVDNIAIDGDTATADATVVGSTGGKTSYTDTGEVTLVKEDGLWRDCTPQ
jgi:hypothetical protein